jgi:hypothetical protein
VDPAARPAAHFAGDDAEICPVHLAERRMTGESAEPRDPLVWHVLLVMLVSVVYEAQFVSHSLNVVDEGWPLAAAMRLHHGGVLYDDVFFVFPPGHLLVAWIAYWLDPPGVVMARVLYSSFTVLLCVGIYLLGRRITTPTFALYGALLLSLAAMSSHMQQLLFGYRYLAISLFAMLAFAEYMRTREERFIFVAGLLTGVALAFRLTPAFAVSCAVLVGVMAMGGPWRSWIRVWTVYGVGLSIVALPLILWFFISVGPEKLWLEVVVRPVAMTDQQSLPMPKLRWIPLVGTRRNTSIWWVGIQFRAWTLMYACYALALATLWLRAIRARRPFEHPLLLAVVVWGGIYYLRSFGRSDAPHLFSAIAPVCMLLSHASSLVVRPLVATGAPPWRRRAFSVLGALFFAFWLYAGSTDLAFTGTRRDQVPLESLDGRVTIGKGSSLVWLDQHVALIERYTRPGDTIFDMSASSLYYVLSDRLGPGYFDVIMPGTFLSEEEEEGFLAHLKAHPPALVIMPGRQFDGMASRSIWQTAPKVTGWVMKNHRRIGRRGQWMLFLPNESKHLPPLPRRGKRFPTKVPTADAPLAPGAHSPVSDAPIKMHPLSPHQRARRGMDA